jgi:hypothetical protein
MTPNDMYKINIPMIIAQTKDGGPGDPVLCAWLTMLPKRRRMTPKDASMSIQPINVESFESFLSPGSRAVASDINPQNIQQIVETMIKISVSVDPTPLRTAITKSMIVAVIAYSHHLIQLLPRSTSPV